MSKEDFLDTQPQTRKRPTRDQNIQLVNNFYSINPKMSPEEVFSLTTKYRQYMNSHKNAHQRNEETKLRNARLLERGISPQNCILFEIVQPLEVNRQNPVAPFTELDMEMWAKKVPEGIKLFAIQGEITTQLPEMMGKYYNNQNFWEIYMLKPELHRKSNPDATG